MHTFWLSLLWGGISLVILSYLIEIGLWLEIWMRKRKKAK